MTLRRRGWNHLRADAMGYFWIPCPNCGQMFGGHETGGGTLWESGDEGSQSGKIMCPDCPDDIYAPGYQGPRFVEVSLA